MSDIAAGGGCGAAAGGSAAAPSSNSTALPDAPATDGALPVPVVREELVRSEAASPAPPTHDPSAAGNMLGLSATHAATIFSPRGHPRSATAIPMPSFRVRPLSAPSSVPSSNSASAACSTPTSPKAMDFDNVQEPLGDHASESASDSQPQPASTTDTVGADVGDGEPSSRDGLESSTSIPSIGGDTPELQAERIRMFHQMRASSSNSSFDESFDTPGSSQARHALIAAAAVEAIRAEQAARKHSNADYFAYLASPSASFDANKAALPGSPRYRQSSLSSASESTSHTPKPTSRQSTLRSPDRTASPSGEHADGSSLLGADDVEKSRSGPPADEEQTASSVAHSPAESIPHHEQSSALPQSPAAERSDEEQNVSHDELPDLPSPAMPSEPPVRLLLHRRSSFIAAPHMMQEIELDEENLAALAGSDALHDNDRTLLFLALHALAKLLPPTDACRMLVELKSDFKHGGQFLALVSERKNPDRQALLCVDLHDPDHHHVRVDRRPFMPPLATNSSSSLSANDQRLSRPEQVELQRKLEREAEQRRQEHERLAQDQSGRPPWQQWHQIQQQHLTEQQQKEQFQQLKMQRHKHYEQKFAMSGANTPREPGSPKSTSSMALFGGSSSGKGRRDQRPGAEDGSEPSGGYTRSTSESGFSADLPDQADEHLVVAAVSRSASAASSLQSLRGGASQGRWRPLSVGAQHAPAHLVGAGLASSSSSSASPAPPSHSSTGTPEPASAASSSLDTSTPMQTMATSPIFFPPALPGDAASKSTGEGLAASSAPRPMGVGRPVSMSSMAESAAFSPPAARPFPAGITASLFPAQRSVPDIRLSTSAPSASSSPMPMRLDGVAEDDGRSDTPPSLSSAGDSVATPMVTDDSATSASSGAAGAAGSVIAPHGVAVPKAAIQAVECFIGLSVPVVRQMTVLLSGNGAFVVRLGHRAYSFHTASVRSLWSTISALRQAAESAPESHAVEKDEDFQAWIAPYHALVQRAQKSPNHRLYRNIGDLEIRRRSSIGSPQDLDHKLDAPLNVVYQGGEGRPAELDVINKLREFMMCSDLDSVTPKEMRTALESHFNIDMNYCKKFIDEKILVIMGQLEPPSKILEYLYLGTEWNASNKEELQRLGVGYVLNMAWEIDNFFPLLIQYHHCLIHDENWESILPHFDNTYRFIKKAVDNNSKVLVHCKMGVSRSASAVIAYIMKSLGWPLKKSLEFVKSQRRIIRPNPGFTKQLEEYEGILAASKLYSERVVAVAAEAGNVPTPPPPSITPSMSSSSLSEIASIKATGTSVKQLTRTLLSGNVSPPAADSSNAAVRQFS
ncbi:hypothetical protein CAOG_05820 [Capsaspora owczarzaki ATCC 30864]|uniref:protein-serine/threonine phosphatase n=1 Tax=Capsaspora owczarzaki (strain ATCC 30864) TaxID=595528 RepID=A0A0D2UJT8_CAPO3|nr:hypothetical protein CAOG_05820 [Capsaspora owczarzaki ATCC 30864]KJE95366.1 hypothetical protein CAOG_005820 [Capsaspora owczarzaki ATCC 30864]|eukprot:XP_004345410.1 hypothetical protein CAOG_05820 [Capsaspora owczarzaki ATCC 30864]